MVALSELVTYSDDLLEVERFRDYCPNGLQVEGRSPVRKLVSGVTACQGLVDAAINAEADALLVHHGYFWKGEAQRITGMKQRRLKALLQADLSLIAYHLPLDAHPVYGNNAQLAVRLGLSVDGRFGEGGEAAPGMYGQLTKPLSGAGFAQRLQEVIGQEPLHIAGTDHPLQSIAWCSGAAQGYIEQAVALGVDAYLTGEVSEQTVHVARECGIHFFAAGHHATERYGVQAFGEHLAQHFGLDHLFIDIENPV